MPDDFARTQAQLAAEVTLPAATLRAAAAVVEVHGPDHLARAMYDALDRPRSHDRPGMIPRDVPEPPPANLANLEGQ